MRFETVQRHDLAPGDLVDALYSPGFLAHLADHAGFAAPEVLDHEDDGVRILQRARYRYVGPLPAGAGRFIDPARLTWVHELRFDRTSMRGRFDIRPDHYADRLVAGGDERVEPVAGSTTATLRTVSGDLRVAIPFVGQKVERAVVGGLRDHLDHEVEALRTWIGRRQH